MSFVLIPFGKETGKKWLKYFLIITPILFLFFLYICILEDVSNETLKNPMLPILLKLLCPLYCVLLWCLNFILRWGILSVIPIILVVIIFSYARSFINERMKKSGKVGN